MLPCQLRIALRHLDVQVAKDLREFVKITVVHYVPRRESVRQIIKGEILDANSFE